MSGANPLEALTLWNRIKSSEIALFLTFWRLFITGNLDVQSRGKRDVSEENLFHTII